MRMLLCRIAFFVVFVCLFGVVHPSTGGVNSAWDVAKVKKDLVSKEFQFSLPNADTMPDAVKQGIDKAYVCSTVLSPDAGSGSFELEAEGRSGTGLYVWNSKYYHSKNLKYSDWGSVDVGGQYRDTGLLYQRGQDPFFLFVSTEPLKDGTFKMYIKDGALTGTTGSFRLFQTAQRVPLK